MLCFQGNVVLLRSLGLPLSSRPSQLRLSSAKITTSFPNLKQMTLMLRLLSPSAAHLPCFSLTLLVSLAQHIDELQP